MSALVRSAIYADLLRLPEHETGEILSGSLHAERSGLARQSHVRSGLAAALGRSVDLPRLPDVVLLMPALHLEAHVIVPDLAGWRRERLPEIPDGPITVVPDWICEILSPPTAMKDRAIKLPIYGELGVKHAWIVDPAAKTIEVLRRDSEHWVLLATHADKNLMRAEPFDAIALELGNLWAW